MLMARNIVPLEVKSFLVVIRTVLLLDPLTVQKTGDVAMFMLSVIQTEQPLTLVFVKVQEP